MAAICAIGLLLSACASGSERAAGDNRAIRVAAFDFPESQILAALYATALREHGVHAMVVGNAGTREVVQPALEQGEVDVVPEYQASALAFLRGSSPGPPNGVPPPAGRAAYAALVAALAPRGVVALAPAAARDENSFVMTRARAGELGVSRLSQLGRVSRSLILGAPPECPARPYCLQGLQRVYGVAFRSFVPMPSRAVTAQSLLSGEIDVGMIDTTDPSLADQRLQQLVDDRRLQPPENVVPVVRAKALRTRGSSITTALNSVSARLTTRAVIAMNRRVAVDGLSPAAAAAEWWARVSPRVAGTSGERT